MNKKSQGHVEMMLSFVLFMSVILFIFVYLNPFEKKIDNSNEVNFVSTIILNNATTSLGKLGVIGYDASNPALSKCYNVNIDSYSQRNYIEVAQAEDGVNNKYPYVIYFSDIFPGKVAPHLNSGCVIGTYKIGTYSEEKIIYYDYLKKIRDFGNSESGYVQIKKLLGINNGFMFNVKDLEGNIISDLTFNRNLPKSVQVGSKEFPIRVIKSDGKIYEYIFNIKVW